MLPNTEVKRYRYRTVFYGLLIFVLALIIRVNYLQNTVIYNPIMKDAREYMTYVDNLLSYGIYSQSKDTPPIPDGQISPGYPLFLAAVIDNSHSFQSGYINIQLIQATLGSLTAVLVYVIGLSLMRLPFALAAAALTALSPHLISFTAYILTETLFTFLMILAFSLLALGNYKRSSMICLVASFAFGLSSLVRPALLLFPLFIAPLLVLSWPTGKKGLVTLSLIVGVSIAWAPWAIWKKMAVPVSDKKASLASLSLLAGTYPNLIHKDPRFRGAPYKEDEKFNEMTADIKVARDILWDRFKEDPSRYISWYFFGKPAMFWSWSIINGQGGIYVYPVISSLYDVNPAAALSLKIMKFLHPILVLISLVGIVLLFRRVRELKSRELALLVFGLLIYFTAIHTILMPLPRYSIPLRPLLYLSACLSLDMLFRLARARKVP